MATFWGDFLGAVCGTATLFFAVAGWDMLRGRFNEWRHRRQLSKFVIERSGRGR